MESITTDEMDFDACFILQEILCDKVEDEELHNFAIDNLDELLSYIAKGNLNTKRYRDIIGETWFVVDRNNLNKKEVNNHVPSSG